MHWLAVRTDSSYVAAAWTTNSVQVSTYNLWVLISVVLGTGIGYLLLRPLILYCIGLAERNPPQRGDIEMQPLFEDPFVKMTTAGKENEILGKYFGSIKNHLDYLKRKKIYNVQSEEEKEQVPSVRQLLFTREDRETNNCQEDQEYEELNKRHNEDTSLSKLDGEERWKLVRDTFKRISKTRLQWRRQRGLPARIEQMGGLNDTFELEMDTWVQNESDVFHERSNTLCHKPTMMYVTVV
ncbi:hypothetical protein FSP39_008692 [Pinctada imbricata]|uniref:Uncharacterized protein n=1 Tax=Pinctada imbricata TaxID=66713 RepID=A0AA88XQR7_PINIB|nr:hypothetical protein FSP39_008692 [Pinctada imbricata]